MNLKNGIRILFWMTTRKWFLLPSVFLALSSCAGDKVQTVAGSLDGENCRLTVAEAEGIFVDYASKVSEMADTYEFGRFYLSQGVISVDTSRAVRYHERYSGNDNVEFGFLPVYGLQFYTSGRNGRKWPLESHQCILIVRNSENGGKGAFVMTVVADRSYSGDGHIPDLCEFHNSGNSACFSGLVIYSRLSGAVIRADRYRDGVRILSANLQKIRDFSDFNSRMSALERVFGKFQVERISPGLSTRCIYGCSPDDSCGHPDGNGFWDNDSTPIPLDSAAYCLADTVEYDPEGVFGPVYDWSGDWLPDGYWDENEPDPSPGSVGGANDGKDGSDGGVEYKVTVGDKTLVMDFKPGLSADEIALFKEKFQELVGNEIFQKIIADTDQNRVEIIVMSPSSFRSFESGLTTPISSYTPDGLFKEYFVKIRLNPEGDIYGYMEEFFHSMQYLSSNQKIEFVGDIEFEAKVFLATILHNLTKKERKA